MLTDIFDIYFSFFLSVSVSLILISFRQTNKKNNEIWLFSQASLITGVGIHYLIRNLLLPGAAFMITPLTGFVSVLLTARYFRGWKEKEAIMFAVPVSLFILLFDNLVFFTAEVFIKLTANALCMLLIMTLACSVGKNAEPGTGRKQLISGSPSLLIIYGLLQIYLKSLF